MDGTPTGGRYGPPVLQGRMDFGKRVPDRVPTDPCPRFCAAGIPGAAPGRLAPPRQPTRARAVGASPTVTNGLLALCRCFARNREAFHASGVKEAHVRQSLIDPFFEALGWNVADNPPGAEGQVGSIVAVT